MSTGRPWLYAKAEKGCHQRSLNGLLSNFMNRCSKVTLLRVYSNRIFSFRSISRLSMSNVSFRTQKQLSAQLQHLAIEAERATNKRRRESAEKRFRDANRPLRPIGEVFASRQP